MNRGAVLAAVLVAVTSVQAEVKHYTGQYRYMADAASFEDCLTGDRWPVAQKAANAELERIYLEKQQAGEPLWVSVEGEAQRKLDLVAGKRITFFVVHKVFETAIRDCEALQPVPLVGTHWVLTDLRGRPVRGGKRRDAYLMLQLDSGKAFGFGGCNHFKVRYALDGDAIRFEQLGATRMRCQSGYELETAYLRMLQQADRWRIRGKFLDLFDANGKRIARLMADDRR